VKNDGQTANFSENHIFRLSHSLPEFLYAQPESPPLRLAPLIEEALLNNPEIMTARQKWEAYKEKVPQAYAWKIQCSASELSACLPTSALG